jgi:hypothetical protein
VLTRSEADNIARQYFGTSEPLAMLGWGIAGFVYLSPDRRSVVKVHSRAEGFHTELDVYRRLAQLRITQLHGLTIPRLINHRDDLKVIEMDFVSAPYLVDFAGVRFDPPDFPEDTMNHWHATIRSYYGPNATVAYAVYESLRRHGIYYMDFRPSNMKLDGLPGLLPFNPAESDAFDEQ